MPTNRSAREERSARYRRAADLAIEQLDWTVNYFHRVRKHRIARALRENRMSIVRRYREY